MSSKAFMFLGLLVAMVLVISSQVTARELAEDASTSPDTFKEAEKKNVAINDAKYPGGGYNEGGGYPGGRGEVYPGSGHKGGGGYNGGRGNGGSNGHGKGGSNRGRGNYCRYGCCGSRNYYKGGCRCCTFAGEKVDAQPQN